MTVGSGGSEGVPVSAGCGEGGIGNGGGDPLAPRRRHLRLVQVAHGGGEQALHHVDGLGASGLHPEHDRDQDVVHAGHPHGELALVQ